MQNCRGYYIGLCFSSKQARRNEGLALDNPSSTSLAFYCYAESSQPLLEDLSSSAGPLVGVSGLSVMS